MAKGGHSRLGGMGQCVQQENKAVHRAPGATLEPLGYPGQGEEPWDPQSLPEAPQGTGDTVTPWWHPVARATKGRLDLEAEVTVQTWPLMGSAGSGSGASTARWMCPAQGGHSLAHGSPPPGCWSPAVTMAEGWG